jgi:antibiotic biosynthesis monooxygenase (ABM) superfamily enzyme
MTPYCVRRQRAKCVASTTDDALSRISIAAVVVSANRALPPRWKVAVVTWLGIFPTVYLLFLLLGDWLAPWSLLSRIFVLTMLVVVIMTWGVAPQLTKLLKTWLYPAATPKR